MRPVALLTNPIDPAGTGLLAQHADVRIAPGVEADALRRAVRDAHVLIVRATLPDDLFEHAPVLRGVVRHGAGIDMIPLRQAGLAAMPVSNTPRVNATSVAEYAAGQMVNLAHRLARTASLLREGGWSQARTFASGATELAGKTVGIVGVGAVGSETARICRDGFRMRVVGYQRNLSRLPAGVAPVGLNELLRAADFVVLCCALTDATRGLIGRAELSLMKPSACVVNVSRGAVIDEAALVAALRSGQIAGAALDVFLEQPLAPGHPLFALENVLLTPHAAGLTVESMQRMSAVAVKDALRMLRGERPEHLVNPEIWPAALERWSRLGSLPTADQA